MDEMQGIFLFDPDDRIYQEHFPGNPIVPGSVIIDSFLSVLKQAGRVSGGVVIERLRFRSFVFPGECTYRLRFGSDGIACELFQDDQLKVTGRLKP